MVGLWRSCVLLLSNVLSLPLYISPAEATAPPPLYLSPLYTAPVSDIENNIQRVGSCPAEAECFSIDHYNALDSSHIFVWSVLALLDSFNDSIPNGHVSYVLVLEVTLLSKISHVALAMCVSPFSRLTKLTRLYSTQLYGKIEYLSLVPTFLCRPFY